MYICVHEKCKIARCTLVWRQEKPDKVFSFMKEEKKGYDRQNFPARRLTKRKWSLSKENLPREERDLRVVLIVIYGMLRNINVVIILNNKSHSYLKLKLGRHKSLQMLNPSIYANISYLSLHSNYDYYYFISFYFYV